MGSGRPASSRPPPGRPLAALGQVLSLTEADLELYRAAVGRSSLPLVELAALAGLPELDAADRLGRLIAAGVVTRSSTEPVQYRARHPESVVGERLERMYALAAAARDAAAELAVLVEHRSGEPAERVVGADRIRDSIADLGDSARGSVCVIALPAVPIPWTPATRPDVAVRTVWPDEAGVETLVPAPRSPRPTGEIRAATVRLSCGLVLLDDRAVLAVSEPAGAAAEAVLHRHAGTVAACTALFELVWRSARPVWPPPSPAAGNELTEPERALIGMLNLGLTDAAVANRLAVSVRTVGRRLDELMTRLNARTRFQAGVEAARRGWL